MINNPHAQVHIMIPALMPGYDDGGYDQSFPTSTPQYGYDQPFPASTPRRQKKRVYE
jgi:hypothetical protein